MLIYWPASSQSSSQYFGIQGNSAMVRNEVYSVRYNCPMLTRYPVLKYLRSARHQHPFNSERQNLHPRRSLGGGWLAGTQVELDTHWTRRLNLFLLTLVSHRLFGRWVTTSTAIGGKEIRWSTAWNGTRKSISFEKLKWEFADNYAIE